MSTPTENTPPPSDDNDRAKKIYHSLRRAVRYGRTDIKGTLCRKSLLQWAKPFDVELQDISTRGAHVVSKHKLNLNATYILTIAFSSGKFFEIEGKIIHRKDSSEDAYGFKFNAYNDELGDYLLNTQTDLIFK
ncbi:MAG: PilZ domain-containing protein [Gammaproteobacteria bacterium]